MEDGGKKDTGGAVVAKGSYGAKENVACVCVSVKWTSSSSLQAPLSFPAIRRNFIIFCT